MAKGHMSERQGRLPVLKVVGKSLGSLVKAKGQYSWLRVVLSGIAAIVY